jgi:hypothetical protein
VVSKIFLNGIFQGNSFGGDFRYTRIWHHTEKGCRRIPSAQHSVQQTGGTRRVILTFF